MLTGAREDSAVFLWPMAAKRHCMVQNRKVARPTRFERVTFAFGGQHSFFEPNVGRSFRKPADLIAQTPTFGIAARGSPCSIAAKTTMALELARYCASSFGTAMLYRRRRSIIEGRTSDRLKNLK
jgi:hypothetical protein